MILVNGHIDDRIAAKDRGLQYGDGLFETIAYRNKQLEFFDAHLARLLLGCDRLAIPTTFLADLKNDLEVITAELDADMVIKIIITRGSGGRGYKSPDLITPTRIVSTHPIPEYTASNTCGVKVISCKQIVSENPQLAGIKHLNRLEQVIARSEWSKASIAEGLMANIHGHIIEGTMSNVFMVKNNQLMTPELSLSGINGIMRQHVLSMAKQLGLTTNEVSLTYDDLVNADEAFLTNSLISIWPITSVDGSHSLPYGEITKQLQNELVNTK